MCRVRGHGFMIMVQGVGANVRGIEREAWVQGLEDSPIKEWRIHQSRNGGFANQGMEDSPIKG